MGATPKKGGFLRNKPMGFSYPTKNEHYLLGCDMGGSTILGNTQINKKIPSKKKKGGSKNQPANQPTNQDISRSEALVHPKH